MSREAIGYEGLVQQLGLRALPHWRATFLTERSTRHSHSADGQQIEEYPRGYFGGFASTPLGNLEFALKHEGLNLAIIKAAFDHVSASDVAELIRQQPYGKARRRLWFLWEFLRQQRLDVPDLALGNYVPLLDEALYFAPRGTHSRRHRIRANLLGDQRFCPLVRRTPALERWVAMRLDEEARRLVGQHDATTLHRAVAYLYAKETRSSYAIERESPGPDRIERFVRSLRAIDREGSITKGKLVELQNAIVSDPRFADPDYRQLQNYISETNLAYQEVVHFVSPRPEDVPELMAGLLDALTSGLAEPSLHPVVLAAMISFGFVFIHPFDDGNGRLHRYLIHHVLARSGFTPAGTIVPVSAQILADLGAYDACLEAFSRPLLGCVRYELDEDARMRVLDDTADHYRFIDCTPMAEYLFGCLERAIHSDLADELRFLVGFDAAKKAVEAQVDLPARLVTLFIRLCAQNGWRLSAAKRHLFDVLRDDEIASLEGAVRDAFDRAGRG